MLVNRKSTSKLPLKSQGFLQQNEKDCCTVNSLLAKGFKTGNRNFEISMSLQSWQD